MLLSFFIIEILLQDCCNHGAINMLDCSYKNMCGTQTEY